MKFHESIQTPTPYNFEKLKDQFGVIYEQYRETRKKYQELEKIEDVGEVDQSVKEIIETKEQLAEIVMSIFSQSTSLEDFENKLREVLAKSGNVPIEEIDDYILSGYVYPTSMKNKKIHSPVESIFTTLENLKIVAYFAKIAEKNAHGMLLSGGMSHTPFLGIRGKIPETLVEHGAKQLEHKEFSDIDLMFTFENLNQMKLMLADFVEAGVVSPNDMERFELFEKFKKENKMDTFSVRTHLQGVEQSLHLLLNETLENIARGTEPLKRGGVGFVRDFRPNTPRSAEKKGQYVAYDIKDGGEIGFDIHIEPVKAPLDKGVAGYLSETPTGGVVRVNSEERYLVSILSWFLLVAPTILIDKNSNISSRVHELQERVKIILKGNSPIIARCQQKMSKVAFKRLQSSLI